MPSILRSISALFGIVLAAPLTAQTVAMKSTVMVAAVAKLTTVHTDTAVTWIVLRSNQGELQGKLRQLIKAEIAKARARGLTPFLELGAVWCGPCKELEARLHDKDMIDAFSSAYMIHLDLNEWDVGEELAYPIKGVLPMMLTIDERGKVTGEVHGLISPESIKQYLHAHFWKSPSSNKLAAK